MAILSILIQLIGLCAGIYIAFTRSVVQGVALVVVIGIGHFIFSKVAVGLMFLHQKTLSHEELEQLYLQAKFGDNPTPKLWELIATGCSLVFFICAAVVIWLFLQG